MILILRIINLVTLLGNYSFKNIKLVETMVEGNTKGDVLKIQRQDSILYESGESECISPNAEAEAETEAEAEAEAEVEVDISL
jgi:hypothetical protein